MKNGGGASYEVRTYVCACEEEGVSEANNYLIGSVF